MIYSIFPFLDEFHLLDLKINEEIDVVDKIIVIDCNMTFSGIEKEPLLWQRKKQYSDPKIEIRFFDAVNAPKSFPRWAWSSQKEQRNAGIPEYKEMDIIFTADVDWIINKEIIPEIVDMTLKGKGYTTIETKMYYYYLNLLANKKVSFPFIRGDVLYQRFSGLISDTHRYRGYDHFIIEKSRHFGYFKNAANISRKIMSFGHQEWNLPKYTAISNIKNKMKGPIFEDPLAWGVQLNLIEIDGSYPQTILKNREIWKKWVYDPDSYWKL